nr:MAG TPA: hypothetical protein [Caudoviricetes sp.]
MLHDTLMLIRESPESDYRINPEQNRCSSLPFPQYFGLQPSAHFLKRTSTKNQT